jgi:hypothetical protein
VTKWGFNCDCLFGFFAGQLRFRSATFVKYGYLDAEPVITIFVGIYGGPTVAQQWHATIGAMLTKMTLGQQWLPLLGPVAQHWATSIMVFGNIVFDAVV